MSSTGSNSPNQFQNWEDPRPGYTSALLIGPPLGDPPEQKTRPRATKHHRGQPPPHPPPKDPYPMLGNGPDRFFRKHSVRLMQASVEADDVRVLDDTWHHPDWTEPESSKRTLRDLRGFVKDEVKHFFRRASSKLGSSTKSRRKNKNRVTPSESGIELVTESSPSLSDRMIDSPPDSPRSSVSSLPPESPAEGGSRCKTCCRCVFYSSTVVMLLVFFLPMLLTTGLFMSYWWSTDEANNLWDQRAKVLVVSVLRHNSTTRTKPLFGRFAPTASGVHLLLSNQKNGTLGFTPVHALLETVPGSFSRQPKPSQVVVADHPGACLEAKALANDSPVFCAHSSVASFSRTAWGFVVDPDSCSQLPDVWLFEDSSLFVAERDFGPASASLETALDEFTDNTNALLATWEKLVARCGFSKTRNALVAEGNGGELAATQGRVTAAWFLN